MENFKFLLKAQNQRVVRAGLIRFLEGISLHVLCGYELNYSWKETLASLRGVLPVELVEFLEIRSSENLSQTLLRLGSGGAIPQYQIWFQVLSELYQSGGPLRDATQGLVMVLRKEQEREFETHVRNLPTKLNICLILFFLPPTFLLLFFPLLLEFLRAF